MQLLSFDIRTMRVTHELGMSSQRGKILKKTKREGVMQVVSMNLITELIALKESNRIPTRVAMEMLVEEGLCKADDLPSAQIMDALIRGIKQKKRSAIDVKKLRAKRANDLIEYIETEAEYTIPNETKNIIREELYAHYQLNGCIAQSYIDNLIKVFKHAKKEAASHAENTASVAV